MLFSDLYKSFFCLSPTQGFVARQRVWDKEHGA